MTTINNDRTRVFSYTNRSLTGNGLFETYFDRLYSLVFYSIGKNRIVAEEITQDTFLTALKSVRGYTGKIDIFSWLIGIANHKIVDYYRRKKKEHKNVNQICLDNTHSGLQIIDSGFECALFNLPVHYRQVLLLKYVEEMPVQDISRIMNRSPKSIEGILTRARIALKTAEISPTHSR